MPSTCFDGRLNIFGKMDNRHFSRSGRFALCFHFIYDFPIEDGADGAAVLQFQGVNGKGIPVPYHDVRVFSGFQGPGFVFKARSVIGPGGVGLQDCGKGELLPLCKRDVLCPVRIQAGDGVISILRCIAHTASYRYSAIHSGSKAGIVVRCGSPPIPAAERNTGKNARAVQRYIRYRIPAAERRIDPHIPSRASAA